MPMPGLPNGDTTQALIRLDERLSGFGETLSRIESQLVSPTEFATLQANFETVQRIVYSGAGLILIGVIAAVLNLVIVGR